MNGDTLDNDFDTGMAIAFLADTIMPDYRDDVIDWLSEDALTSVERKGGGGLETTVIGGRQVELAVSKSSGKLSFSIKPPVSAQITDTQNTRETPLEIEFQPSGVSESVDAKGLGISRQQGQSPFEEIGYTFKPAIARADGEPQTAAYGANDDVVIAMTGPDDNLVTAWVSGDIAGISDDVGSAMALLVKTVMPVEYKDVGEWLNNAAMDMTDDPIWEANEQHVKQYGDKYISLSSLPLIGHVTFKIDSSSDPAQIADTRIATEPEIDCALVRRVYWLVRGVGDHQMAVMSVWDEMVKANPHADFGMDSAVRAVEECGIEP